MNESVRPIPTQRDLVDYAAARRPRRPTFWLWATDLTLVAGMIYGAATTIVPAFHGGFAVYDLYGTEFVLAGGWSSYQVPLAAATVILLASLLFQWGRIALPLSLGAILFFVAAWIWIVQLTEWPTTTLQSAIPLLLATAARVAFRVLTHSTERLILAIALGR